MAKRLAENTTGSIQEGDQHREWLLAKLRSASLQAKMMDAELTSIGVALKGGMISAESAVSWIREQGLLWFITPMPEEMGRLDKSCSPQLTDQNESETSEERDEIA